MSRPLRVAIVGAGPSGMYAAGHLLEGPGGTYVDGHLTSLVDQPVEVDVFDRLPTQWGLVRHGVAPDHPEKKLAQTVFEHIAARPGFRFFGNIEIGNHVRPQELSQWYDAVVYAVGASGDTAMGIPGEDLHGCLAARVFVAWYNGHPDYRDIEVDLSHERVVVIGNGNVALDVARILTTPIALLERTDIADHALEALRNSKVREVMLLGRRAHFHGAFNNPELEELGVLDGVDIIVEHGDLPDNHEAVLGELDATTRRKLATLETYANRPLAGHDKRIVLRFLTSPIEVLGEQRVAGLLVSRNHLERDDSGRLHVRPTSEEAVIDTGLVLRAIGYCGVPLPGLPFDERFGIIPNVEGRVRGMPATYVTGWIKRGPRGIIGTNKKCARDTVRALLADARSDTLPNTGTLIATDVDRILRQRQPHLIDQLGWLHIDDKERAAGRAAGRPRIKITEIDQLVAAATGEPAIPANHG